MSKNDRQTKQSNGSPVTLSYYEFWIPQTELPIITNSPTRFELIDAQQCKQRRDVSHGRRFGINTVNSFLRNYGARMLNTTKINSFNVSQKVDLLPPRWHLNY
mmetsp:Transcript_25508/g.70232  ORF Transcript_25508/g.70232 Transcript_25508/m.70232 type:complete len:103 (-) Transcript_25508:214-522(-)